MKRVIAFIAVFVLIMAFSTTALAYQHSWSGNTWRYVYGGGSQYLAYNVVREQPERIDLRIDGIDWLEQEQLRIKGYEGTGTTACTPLTEITGYGSNLAYYTSTEVDDSVSVKISIKSSSVSDYLRFQGGLYV